MEQNKKPGLTYNTIAPFLDTAGTKTSRMFSFAGLGLGVLLLLCCVQMYININQLLKEKNIRKDGYDYISVTKTITNENMGKDNSFSESDIEELKNKPFITDAAPLISNQFRVKASAGNIIPFSTDLFLESLKDDFIDTVPASFTWKTGQADVPIIFSADFLEMYNVFSRAYDLPQVSVSTVSAINIILECYSSYGVQTFRGHIVAVSDRINSILVPESFLTWANKNYGQTTSAPVARVYLKTTDANNTELLNFLTQKNYYTNKDKTKFGRTKQILQAVVSGLGGFAILVILLAMMLFSFYLQLMIARSRNNLELLLTLGYSPGWLSRTVSKKWIPVYTGIVIIALIATAIFQYIFQQYVLLDRPELSPWVSLYVLIIAAVLLALCIIVNYRLIRRLLFRL